MSHFSLACPSIRKEKKNNNQKLKEKKMKLNNNLAVLLSHDIGDVFWSM